MKKKWVLRYCDLDLWPKVTKFNRVRASARSNHLAKTASKSVHLFGWNFVHKKTSDTQTDTQTNWSENITPPRYRGGVKSIAVFGIKSQSNLIYQTHALMALFHISVLTNWCYNKTKTNQISEKLCVNNIICPVMQKHLRLDNKRSKLFYTVKPLMNNKLFFQGKYVLTRLSC